MTRARRREFDLPENELVRAVCGRLLELLTRLRRAEVVGPAGWARGLPRLEGELQRLLNATVLREVPEVAMTPFHERAAESARREVYRLALDWHRDFRNGLDVDDPQTIARVVSEGALAPLCEPTRFELAVVVRLVQALEAGVERVSPGRWTLRRTLVMSGRREIAELVRDDGARVSVFYNQVVLDSGACDQGAMHYLGQSGRLRPDVTIVMRTSEGATRACVVEVKCSADPRYILSGLHESESVSGGVRRAARWMASSDSRRVVSYPRDAPSGARRGGLRLGPLGLGRSGRKPARGTMSEAVESLVFE